MRIRYDWPIDGEPPGPGDTLVCLRQRDRNPTGTAYLILAARPVKTRDGSRAMRYEVARITAAEAVDAPRWEPLFWHRR